MVLHRSDLIEVFKMAKNLLRIPLTKFFQLDTDNRTRGHSFKLVKHRCNCEVRRHFFSERVVNRWNLLDQATIFAKTELENYHIRKSSHSLYWQLFYEMTMKYCRTYRTLLTIPNQVEIMSS